MVETTAKFVRHITVLDPDTGADVELEVWKDPESGSLLAVEASFLDQVRGQVFSPYNEGHILKEPELYESDESFMAGPGL